MADANGAAIAGGATDEGANLDLNALFELGMAYSTGSDGVTDFVAAHKWFNIAAMLGHTEATAYRREIAAEMSDADIGVAQRAARDWLKTHHKPAPISAAA
jgi:TPR repeat protein